MSGEGNKLAKILLLGMSPGRDEEVVGRPFIGPAGQLLNDCLKQAGIDRPSIWITNTVFFRTQDNGKDRPPTPEEVEVCFSKLEEEIALIKPTVIGVLGNDAMKRILGKTLGITKMRGTPVWSEKYKAHIIPTFHPSYVLRESVQPRIREAMITDLKLINELATTGEITRPDPTKVTLYKTPQEVEGLVGQLNSQEWVSFDIETTSLDHHTGEIRCIAFSWKKGEAHVITDMKSKEILDLLKPFFSNNEIHKVGHNGNFDRKFLRDVGVEVNGYDFDTMLAHHLLDENSDHGLKQLAWLPDIDMGGYEEKLREFRKVEDGNIKLNEAPDEDLWQYCGADADCTLRLKELFEPKLKYDISYRGPANLDLLFKKIVMPMTNVLLDMEWRGIRIDMKKLEYFKKKYGDILEDLDHRLRGFPEVKQAEQLIANRKNNKVKRTIDEHGNTMSEVVKSKKIHEPEPFNFGSPVQLRVLLFDVLRLKSVKETATGNASTDEEVLKEVADRHEIPNMIVQYRSVQKLISTYIDGIKERIDSEGRLHTHYLQHGTVIGRLSSRDPNLQNIIRDHEIKEIFIPDPGFIFLEADYRQMDFRMWAMYSRDDKMAEDLTSGVDIHKLIASEIFNTPQDKVTQEQRSVAKTVVYSMIFKISSYTLAKRLKISEDKATEIITRFYRRYSTARRWEYAITAELKEHLEVRSHYGRARRLPAILSSDEDKQEEAQRQATNSIIQANTADTLYNAMVRMSISLKQRALKSRFVLTVHDSIVLEVPEGEKDEVIKIIRKDMTEYPSVFTELERRVPIEIDLKVGKSWGQMEKVSEEVVGVK